ncbi:MAG: guanylate kinase [Enterococcus lacertideformus]|uniref:Guanylate kinase n=1 Tax=Enterococcus lacertideformus TaxID=2771493 RepID=A0A931AYG3_9ENTE|nr:guanylate kinase [Enterococcus lacertideformus]
MNKCYVFIGPSGSGKTSLAAALFQPTQKIITYTTRQPRKEEIDQKDYYFISEIRFEQMVKKHEFVEWDVYAENKYGSSKAEIMKKLAQGNCYTVLTANGFWALYDYFGERIQPVFVTISQSKLKERLSSRGDTPEQIQKRLTLFEQDAKELKLLEKHPQLILLSNNNTLDKTKKQFFSQLQK